MARSGSKRKSAAQKEIEGNRGKRPIPAEPEFQDGLGVLKSPRRWGRARDGKKADRIEFEEWDRIVPELIACGIAKSVHQGPLEKLCELYAAATREYIAGEYSRFRHTVNAYRLALTEFGLTPAAAPGLGNPGLLPAAPGKPKAEVSDTPDDRFFGPKKVG